MGYANRPPPPQKKPSPYLGQVLSNVLEQMISQFCDLHFLGYEGFGSQFLSIFN